MAIMSKNRTMFKLSYYVFGFENKYCCLFLINKGTLLYDQPSYEDDTDKHRNAYVNNQDICKGNTVGKYNTDHQLLMMGTKTVSETMDINPTLTEPII